MWGTGPGSAAAPCVLAPASACHPAQLLGTTVARRLSCCTAAARRRLHRFVWTQRAKKKRFSSFPWFCFNRPTESLLPLFRSQGSKTRRTGWGGVLEDGSPSMVRTSRSSLFLSSRKHPHTSFVRHVSSDIRLESPTSGFEPLMTSSPSFTTTGRRQRAASLGSSSSISTSYQDITSPLLSRVVAEVTFIHSFVQFILYVRSLLKSLS